MQIRVGFEMVYECPQPTPMIFNVHVHYTRVSDLVGRDDLVVDPPVPISGYRDSFSNWCTRILAPTGWARVQAICDNVHRHIAFGYQHARKTRTALKAFHDRTGVCRDYAHLAVAFCRCMNIPARYCTGYLGDIGVPPEGPMDFAAWFEAFLDGHWYTFDPRNNTPRCGRVLIARGRDAGDVAISTTFGPNTLTSFRVWADEIRAGRDHHRALQDRGDPRPRAVARPRCRRVRDARMG